MLIEIESVHIGRARAIVGVSVHASALNCYWIDYRNKTALILTFITFANSLEPCGYLTRHQTTVDFSQNLTLEFYFVSNDGKMHIKINVVL